MSEVCAKFVVSNHVTEVGCRGFIIARILDSDIEKGTANNIGKNGVEVRLCGEKKKIDTFIEQLKQQLIEKYGNPTVQFSNINYFGATEFSVPKIERSSQAHLLDQFDKGISVLKELRWWFVGSTIATAIVVLGGILLAQLIF